MKRKLFDEPQIPDVVRDEAVIVPRGEVGYWVLLDDSTVELLAQGICPEALAQRMHQNCLDWKREYARQCARELNDIAPLEKATA